MQAEGHKIAVIGGGSTYTPELIEGFARRAQLFDLRELVLYDVDAVRLDNVAGLARRILRRDGLADIVKTSTQLDHAVRDASVVLIQLRVGGQATRLQDEMRGNRYGLIGQETVGVGGFAKALRTIPVVLAIADRVRQCATPGAWIIDFTNPVGMVTRALLDAGHNAIGLCNAGIGFQRFFAQELSIDPAEVVLGYGGLNHLSWVRSVTVAGIERIDEFFGGYHRSALEAKTGVSLDLMRAIRAIPSGYLRYYWSTAAELASQQAGAGTYRAQRVQEIERELLAMYEDPALDHKPALLEQRGGAYYSEAAAALVTSLLSGDGATHFVNVRNDALIAGLDQNAVVEIPAPVDGTGVHPTAVPAFSAELLGLLQAVTAYESLTVRAATQADRDVARRALLAHPHVHDWELAGRVVDDILATDAVHLSQFQDQL